MKLSTPLTVQDLNKLSHNELCAHLFQVCGANVWVNKLTKLTPFVNLDDLKSKALKSWEQCDEPTLLDAFSSHPRIGAKKKTETDPHSTWSNQEQSQMQSAEDLLKEELSALNELYFQKFGFIFIICATGLDPKTMLESLKKRIQNSRDTELKIAAQEQGKIILLRLEKLCQNP